MPSQPQIVISYRTDDTAGYAGWLSRELEGAFPDAVFRGVDEPPLEPDFTKELEGRLRPSKAWLRENAPSLAEFLGRTNPVAEPSCAKDSIPSSCTFDK